MSPKDKKFWNNVKTYLGYAIALIEYVINQFGG